MDVFVTGGSGFVGGAVIRALLEAGARVRAMSRSPQSDAKLALLGAEPVRCSLDGVAAADVEGAEAVVHCAAYVEAWGPLSAYWNANVEGTRRMLEAARAAGVGRFVHIGTEAALFHGQPMKDVDETEPLALNSPYYYSRTKAHAERAVLQAHGPDFATMSLRPRLVWGPGDQTVGPVIKQMAAKGAFSWIGGGKSLTSTCHVDNLAHAVMLAIERGEGGQAYFVTDGPPATVRDFLTAYLGAQGVDLSKSRSIPTPVAGAVAFTGEALWRTLGLPGEPPVTRFAADTMSRECTVSDAKARARIAYRPVLSREEGLAALAEAFDPPSVR